MKIELGQVGTISARQIKREMNPVLRKGERFDVDTAKKEVENYLSSAVIPTKREEEFWRAFTEGKYCPELVFEEGDELQNIINHPMALWKCRHDIKG